MRTERHDVAFVVGAVVGGITAAAITLFRAPQSGAQTRAGIQERLRPVTSTTAGPTRTIASQAQAITNQSVAKGKEIATSVSAKVRHQDQTDQQDTDQITVVEPRATSDLEPSLDLDERRRPLAEAAYSAPVPGAMIDETRREPVQPGEPAREEQPRSTV